MKTINALARTLSVALATLFVSASAFATSPVPWEDITSPTVKKETSAPLVLLRAGTGFPFRGIVSREVALFEDGNVQVTEFAVEDVGDNTRYTRQTFDSLWYFEPAIMEKVKAAVAQIKGGKLVDQNPNDPVPADGGVTSVFVTKNGKRVEFARMTPGKVHLPADKSQHRAAKYLKANMTNLLSSIIQNPR